ncbi:ImmA/IrrE family metallo-endopeptidase [Saccharothrix saharensis]|nr:XRE family transcriptional regulator [Saccharothrix saharensis]
MTGQSTSAAPRMLILARESRGLKQDDVAKAMKALDGPTSKVSQAYVSRAESGRLAVTGERLELYARALAYPVDLLVMSETEVGAGPGLVHHRKKQAAAAPDLRRIHAVLNLSRIQLRGLLDGAPRRVDLSLPRLEVDDYFTGADAARKVRADWGLPSGPLGSVIGVVESTGGLVLRRALVAPVPLDSGNESVPVDAVSVCTPGEDPLVLLNDGTPGDRDRFTTAHELGHMVMHTLPHPQQEKQANQFAAEFLMPAEDIRRDFAGTVDLRCLLELKAQWGVSMWALLRRAHTLGELSDWQYRTLAVEMTSLGYRTSEPGRLNPEQPSAVRSVIDQYLGEGHEVDDLARRARLEPAEFTTLYLGDRSSAATGESEHPVPASAVEVSI